MNPLSLIPPQYQIAARLAAIFIVAFAFATGGWMLRGWKDGSEIAGLKAQHALAMADAAGRALAAQQKADADHQKLAEQLSTIDATSHDNLRRFEHANQDLAARADAGSVRVRVVGATCPAAHDLSQASPGGRVDPGAGAELGADARRRYFSLRGALGQVQQQLAACQRSLTCVTGQGACPAPDSPN